MDTKPWERQPRWPRGTPNASKGPGPGRWRDNGVPTPRVGWAEAVGQAMARSIPTPGGFPEQRLSTTDQHMGRQGDRWLVRLQQRMRHRDYQPGQWTHIDPDAYTRERQEQAVGLFQADGMPYDEARETADRIYGQADPPRAVYVNGPHEVVIDLPGEDDGVVDGDAIVQELDRLIAHRPPAGPVRISVTAGHVIPGGLTLVASDRGFEDTRPIVLLSERVFQARDIREVTSRQEWPMLSRMPAHATVEPWRYILAHEWGHVTHRDEDATLDLRGQNLDSLTGYALFSDVSEAVAEAYAEWFHSGGKTRNRAAIAYAQHYGWGAP